MSGSGTPTAAFDAGGEPGIPWWQAASYSAQFFVYGFKPVLPGLSGETDKPPAMRVRVEGYTKKFPRLIE